MQDFAQHATTLWSGPYLGKKGLENGWEGPAVVVIVESTASLWVKYCGRLLRLALQNVRLATPDELLGYKFAQEAVEELQVVLSGEAWPSCLEPRTFMVPEAVPPAPATEDAESIKRRRRPIVREATAALRRFPFMRKGFRMTRQRSRPPLREEDGKALPVDGEAPPDGEALRPRDDRHGADLGVEAAEPSEMLFVQQQQQQFFEGGGDTSAWQCPAGDESPGMEATFAGHMLHVKVDNNLHK